jgi:hypothetical protein
VSFGGFVHAAVVAGEEHERVFGEALFVERVEHTAHADVQVADEVAKRPAFAFARRFASKA